MDENVYFLDEKVRLKQLIYSIIDNQIEILKLNSNDLNCIYNNFKLFKNAINFNRSILKIFIIGPFNSNYYDNKFFIIKLLICLLGYCKVLKVLSIKDIYILNLNQIFDVLKFNTTLEKLDINSEIVIDDTLNLSLFLENNTTLKVLSLQKITFIGIDNFSQGLSKNKSIIYLNLSDSKIDDLTPLSLVLNNNNTLTHLNLEHITTKNKLDRLFNSLKNNKSIIKINLSKNKLTEYDIYELSKTLKVNNTLKYIDLSYNYINNIYMLLKSLEFNSSKKIINLRDNNIMVYKHLQSFKVNNTLIYKD